MLKGILRKIIGDANQKELDRLRPAVDEILGLEPELDSLSDETLRGFTDEFRRLLGVETAGLRSRLGRLRREFSSERDSGSRERLGVEILRAREALDEQQEKVLDGLLPKAFAVVNQAARRTIGESHFVEQFLGGSIIHQGKVAEMKTGEGKTLVATLPVYLNALTGRGVHVVTVNDYLARRDAVWMGPIYHLLGLSVGVLLEGENRAALYAPDYDKGEHASLREVDRKEAYAADVTYGTNHQFGFDYLRDNLVLDPSRVVQRELNYAIVDEVDNIFIDEARTPLIISGPSSEPLDEYKRFATAVRKLRPGIDFEVDAKERSVVLTEEGLTRIEHETGILDMYDEANFQYVHFMQQALNALALYRRDRDYIVRGRRVVLVDHFTGRLMPDRKLSEGLHQAIEAKEGVPITPRNVVHATITIQNYFRMYRKLSGMTGTAVSEAEEFDKIYGLEVVVVPTHKPMIREDHADVIYKNEKAKWDAIVEEIQECHSTGRPVLVGTTSVEKSERLSRRLGKQSIKCSVLNAKRHAEEAKIIARAGEPGRVTIATSMAGRGVDIKLGGELLEDTIASAHRVLRQRGVDPFGATPDQLDSAIAEVAPEYAQHRQQVLSIGGLHVLGTERHEARRIDNQLRGRAGRQGEPGSSRFFLSLEDDLMRRFGGSRVAGLMDRVGLEEDIPIAHGLVDRAIESTQTRVEGYNFDIRKHLLEYDDVLDTQRKAIYAVRRRILDGESVSSDVREMIETELADQFSQLEVDGASVWDVIARLDGWTFSIAARNAPYRSSHVLLGQASCFPPLSLAMLGDCLTGMARADLRSDLLRRTEGALELYLTHLLDNVIGGGFEQAMSPAAQDRRAERLRELSASLDNQMASYLEQTGRRSGQVNYRAMLQQLQRSFSVPLHVSPSELAGLDFQDAQDALSAAVERSFENIVYENLVSWVERRMPPSLQLGRVQYSDLTPGVWEEFVAAARSRAYSEGAEARIDKLDQAVREPSQANQGAGLLQQVVKIGQWADVDVRELEVFLSQAVEARYRAWSDQIKLFVAAALDRSLAKSSVGECVKDVIQVLLDTYYVIQKARTRSGQTVQSPVPLFPLHFLLADEVANAEPAELQHRVGECLARALDTRELAWAGQELGLLGTQRLDHLETGPRDDLVQYLGSERLREWEDTRIAALDEASKADVLFALRLQALAETRLPELGDAEYQRLLAFLREQLSTAVAAQPVSQLDAQTREAVETCLRARGYFSDPVVKTRYLESTIGELNDDVRSGVARYLGRRFMDAHRDSRYGELGADVLENLRQFYEARRYFVDEERVQRFFVSESLDDLGEELAVSTAEDLARVTLEASRRRRLSDLDKSTRERIRAHLLESGRFRDEEKASLFSNQALLDLDSGSGKAMLTRLGRTRLQIDKPMSEQTDEVREKALQCLRSSGFFRDEELEQTALSQRTADFAAGISELVTEQALVSLREQLGSRTMGELPAEIRDAIHDFLGETDYFIDEDRSARVRGQPVISLDVQTLHNLEEWIGRETMLPLRDVPVGKLDPAVRDDIVGFMRQSGRLRKKRHREAFLQSSLNDVDKEAYDSIAHHLGRSRLNPVRRVPLKDVPSDLQELIWRYVRSTRYVVDEERTNAFDSCGVSDFGPALASELEDHAGAVVLQQLGGSVIGDLPEWLKQLVMRQVAGAGLLEDEARVSGFSHLLPTELDPGLLEGILEELGRTLLGDTESVTFGELSPRLRKQVYAALDGMGYFTDQEALNAFMQSRVEELDSDTLEALVVALGGDLRREIGSRPVSSLSESMRRTLRSLLDEAGAFVDQDRVHRFADLTFSGLAKGDADELAASLGEMRLGKHERSRLVDLEEPLMGSVMACLVEQGVFLDRAKLERFRAGTLDELDAETREAAVSGALAKWQEELDERALAALSPGLASRVGEYLRSSSAGAMVASVSDAEETRVSQLEPEKLSYLAHYLGEQYLQRIEHTPVGDIDAAEREDLRGFLGRRIIENVEKDVLLTSTSALWINYLTAIEDLRQGIGLQAYAKRDPLVEYKHRAYEMYQELQADIRRTVAGRVFRHPPRRPQLLRSEGATDRSVGAPSGSSEGKPPSARSKRKRRSRRRKKSR